MNLQSMISRLTRKILPGTYLNDRHPKPVRMIVAALGGGATFLLTVRPVLAREVARTLWADDFTLGLRRLSWYARTSWLGLNISRDPFFVFCRDLSRPELAAMRGFLEARAPRLAPAVLCMDRLSISATEMMIAFGGPHYPALHARFQREANDALGQIIATPPQTSVAAPQPSPVQADFSLADAEQALRDIVGLLDQNGIECFILSGTFLGAVREGGILAHDYDIDLGVMADSVDIERLSALLHESAPHVCLTAEDQIAYVQDPVDGLRSQSLPVFFKIRHTSGVLVDIFVHYREGDVIWHGSSQSRWDNSAFTLAPYDIAGVTVLGPKDADRYLTENYGDWRVPKVDFHCAIDTTNKRILHNPRAFALALRGLWVAARTKPVDLPVLLSQLQHAGQIEPAPADAAPVTTNKTADTKSDTHAGWRIVPSLFRP